MSFKSPMRLVPAIRNRMEAALGGLPQQYYQKVLSYGPIAYWPLWETAGLTAVDLVNSPAQDGTYNSDVSTWPPATGIGDGNTAPTFDTDDFVDIYSATLNSVFSGSEGTMFIWGRVLNAGVWTDGVARYIALVGVDLATNFVLIRKHTINNQVVFFYMANSVAEIVTATVGPTTDWFTVVITWSAIADQVKAFVNGVQAGATQAGLGAWAGNLGATRCVIGSSNNVAPTSPYNGFEGHLALFDTPLSQPVLAEMSTL